MLMIIGIIDEKTVIQISQKALQHSFYFSLFQCDNERVITCRFPDQMPVSRPLT